MPESLRRGFIRFGVFELDPTSGELLKGGVRRRIRDKPLQVLLALLERPGETITRKELQNRLWPGDTFVEFENGLNNAMSRLRDVLGDSADSPRYIETLPRRGYRFVAPVEQPPVIEADPVPAPALSGAPSGIEGRDRATWRRSRWLVVAGVAVTLALVVGIVLNRREPEIPHSLAVLPFIAANAAEGS